GFLWIPGRRLRCIHTARHFESPPYLLPSHTPYSEFPPDTCNRSPEPARKAVPQTGTGTRLRRGTLCPGFPSRCLYILRKSFRPDGWTTSCPRLPRRRKSKRINRADLQMNTTRPGFGCRVLLRSGHHFPSLFPLSHRL